MCLTVLRAATNWDINILEGGIFDDIVKLKYQKNIGEGINKAISKLVEVNELKGVIDITDFNSEIRLICLCKKMSNPFLEYNKNLQ